MNKKFFELPNEKQERILNAGYKVFSGSTYKKASMQLIADDAGVSKSLLFHYFRNKQSLYEYLFQSAIKLLKEQKLSKIVKGHDFFVFIEGEIFQRLNLMERFPYQYRFIMNVYDEKNTIKSKEINQFILSELNKRKIEVLKNTDRSKFRHEEDLETLYDIIIDLSNGFYFRVFANGSFKNREVLNEFLLYLNNLKRNYYKEAE